MNAIDILGITKCKTGYPQFQKAVLLKAIKGGVKRIVFKYSIDVGSRFTLTAMGMPGLETSVPTKTMRTSRIDLPFVNGDSIEIDGELWTVGEVQFVYNNKSAQLGDARQAVVLYLNGGKGNG